MKVLAFSDLHDESVALERLATLSSKYDFVFACGDISRSELFAESFIGSLPNAFIIPGNWDNESVHKIFKARDQWVHEKRIEITSGFNVVGFGLSPPTPFHTYGELSEDEIYRRMSKLPIDTNTFLLLHAPPYGQFDQTNRNPPHAGSKSILRIIEEKQPFAAFFGHIHEHQGTSKFQNTELIKLPPANHYRACSLQVDIKSRKITAEFISL